MMDKFKEITIDTSKHFLEVWLSVIKTIKNEAPEKVSLVKIAFLSSARAIFGEPFANVACTESNYRRFLSVLNPILNKNGFMLHINITENSYLKQ